GVLRSAVLLAARSHQPHDQVAPGEEVDDKNGNGGQQYGGEQGRDVRPVGGHEVEQPQGDGLVAAGLGHDEREEEPVPGLQRGEHASGGDGAPRQRDDEFLQDPGGPGTVQGHGLVEGGRDVPHPAGEDEDADRERERGGGQDDRPERVVQAQVVDDQEQRDDDRLRGYRQAEQEHAEYRAGDPA